MSIVLDDGFSLYGGSYAFLDNVASCVKKQAGPAADAPRIASIVSPELYQELAPDAFLLPLSAQDFRQTLLFGRPDMVIIEPCARTQDGAWHFHHLVPKKRTRVSDLVAFARSRDIPVYLWVSPAHNNMDEIADLAQIIPDSVCFDPNISQKLAAVGAAPQLFSLPVQPALFSRPSNDRASAAPPILLDGLAHIFRKPRDYGFLAQKQAAQVDVIDSHFHVMPAKIQSQRFAFQARLAGHVPPQILPCVLGLYDVSLLPAESLQPQLMRMKGVVQALAAGLAVVSSWQPPAWFAQQMQEAEAQFHLCETAQQALELAVALAQSRASHKIPAGARIARAHSIKNVLDALFTPHQETSAT